MKKILVLADTHMPKYARTFPKEVLEIINKVDFIIHVGDFSTYETYIELSSYKPIIGVHGNVDDKKLINKLPRKSIVNIEEVSIGIIHGDGKKKTTIKRVQDTFIEDKINLILFGHSHIPLLKNIKGVVLFNPGSPTNKRKEKQYSFGLLTIKNSFFCCEHVFFPYIDK